MDEKNVKVEQNGKLFDAFETKSFLCVPCGTDVKDLLQIPGTTLASRLWKMAGLLASPPYPAFPQIKNAVAFSGLGNDGVTAAGTANDSHVLPS